MQQKEINISEKLYDNIQNYCTYNNIDITSYIEKSLQTKLMIDKYGTSPFNTATEQKQEENIITNEIETTTNIEKKPKQTRTKKEPRTEKKQTVKEPEGEKKIISKRVLK